ncbi:uncharacterized protein STEHIDRAFT_145179 [Stereum hirsutum FP-91666 SS1]|uniref:uncharacterized protein n=1 Tax=Stereum hirsutum (strain FP-91666) TaxID=721885 RepID=UPI0004409EE5|nr:uncharacterized protein STEHIDRAFT_145179 [Stereum hirsutum FP-91666 SS1]EIM90001.1 hypothetical protein STEHIDRAFT_145179 [Stereum hirsutum FP-91666 SS1]
MISPDPCLCMRQFVQCYIGENQSSPTLFHSCHCALKAYDDERRGTPDISNGSTAQRRPRQGSSYFCIADYAWRHTVVYSTIYSVDIYRNSVSNPSMNQLRLVGSSGSGHDYDK